MWTFSDLIGKHKNLSEDAQKSAGKAIAGTMQPQHYAFLTVIAKLIESGSVNVFRPDTFLTDRYQNLSPPAKAKVDQASVNIADALRQAYDFYRSKKTPDESPHLETMIEHLFLMKKRVEDEHGDVYKF